MYIKYKAYKIEIIEDSIYTAHSTDNKYSYDYEYPLSTESFARSISCTKTVIKIYKESKLLKSAIICEPYGKTIESESTFVTDNDKIYICAKDMIYSLNILDLSLNWRKRVDYSDCIAIYKLENDFLVHGELDIVRIDREGNIMWRFGSRESWINTSGKLEVTIEENQIRLFDFDSTEYLIDFEGNEKKADKKWWKI